MAHKKGVGSTDNGRDSNSKRLGVKLFGGQWAKAGNIIVRQRGTRFHPGLNVGIGKDHTLFALSPGFVQFQKRRKNRTFVNIVAEVKEVLDAPVTKKPAPVKKETAPKAEVIEKPVKATPEAAEAKPKAEVAEKPPKESPKAAVAKQKAEAPVAEKKKSSKPDNLKRIEGIGPKTSELLINAGITSFAALAEAKVEKLREILDEAGSRYRIINPGTWPQQAALAAEGKWDDLKALQDKLDGGRA